MVKEKSRDLQNACSQHEKRKFKKRPRPKKKHFTKNFIYRKINADMHDHMLKNVDIM